MDLRTVLAHPWTVPGAAACIDTLLFTRLTEDPQQVYWVLAEVGPVAVIASGVLLVPLLALRNRAPAVITVTLSAYTILLVVAIGSRPLVSLLVGLYAVSMRRPRRLSLICLTAVATAQCASILFEIASLPPDRRLLDAALMGIFYALVDAGIWALGRWSIRIESRTRVLEAARDAAVAAERLRIARELHDIVASSVTLMLVQAGGAQATLHTDLKRADQALQAIQSAGTQAIAEMQRLLTVLRVVGRAGTDEPETRPGLSCLDMLADRFRATGVKVDIRSVGTPTALDVSVDHAVYRVVEEALTNVLRHAGPGSAATISLAWGDSTLTVDVTDDGSGTVDEEQRQRLSSGHGLLGLAERVAVVGGEWEAGPLRQGGFAIRAVLPARSSCPTPSEVLGARPRNRRSTLSETA